MIECISTPFQRGKGGWPLGQLAFATAFIHEPTKPPNLFSAAFADREADITSNDFPHTINVTKANMLYVNKKGLSQKAQNQIRRLAAFGNPEFYRAQAMHQSVYGKNRIIWCGEEDDRHIMLPRGCEQKLVSLANAHSCKCSFDDCRNQGKPINVKFEGKLRERQQEAADTLLCHENGVLSAPTGFGKTVIGAYLIGSLKMRTLVIVPKTNLISQWRMRLDQFLDIKDDRPQRPHCRRCIERNKNGENAPCHHETQRTCRQT